MSKVYEVMKKDFISLSPTISIVDAAKKMRDSGEDVIVICENKNYRGIITKKDIVDYIASNPRNLSRITITSVINKNVPRISTGIDIIDAAKIMARRNIEHMPVVQNGKLLGLLTIDNLIYESPALAIIVMTKHSEMKEHKEQEPAQAYSTFAFNSAC